MYFKCQRSKGLAFVYTDSEKENIQNKKIIRVVGCLFFIFWLNLSDKNHIYYDQNLKIQAEKLVIFALRVL